MIPRATAIQGLGFGPAATAAQGLTAGGSASREVAVQGVGYGVGSLALQGFYRGPGAQPPIGGGGGRRRGRVVKIDPRAWPAEYLARIDAEDDALLLVIAQMIAAGTIH